MIARLEGVLVEMAPTRAVIDVGGVGYAVNIPLSTFTELPDLGKTVVLRVYTHSRDGAIVLYGFLTECERAAFAMLLRANRVGPRLAQTILSGIGPRELLEAIRIGNTALLKAAPGVGSKLAERMLLELRDRTDELAVALSDAGASSSDAIRGPTTTALDQALSALLNLGYSRSQAERAVAGAVAESGDHATLEVLVRGSLRNTVK